MIGLTQAGIDWSPEDLIVREVHRIIASDPSLRAYFEDRIYRRPIFFASSAGVFPRLIVAPYQGQTTGVISRRASGTMTAGIIVEFREFPTDNLTDSAEFPLADHHFGD